MSLGASPLTAYFSPASSSAKRKEYPSAPARKSKTPRTEDSSTVSGGPRKGNATKKHEQELRQHKLTSGPKASSDPSTPSFGNRCEYTTLQTPPASVEVSGRTRSKPSTKPVRSTFPLEIDVVAESSSYLPTPSTRPRPKTRATVSSHPLAAETPCKSAALDLSISKRPSFLSRKTSPAVLPSTSSNVVPSSQCQPELMEALPDENSSWGVIEDQEEPEVGSSDTTRLPEYTHADEAGMTVASSQSQLLVPFQLSPRKKRRDGNPLVIFTTRTEMDDIVPSSQSYEKELQIPDLTESSLPVHNITPPMARPPACTVDKNNFPTRTLSDEMFSVPISSSSILDKLFEEEDHYNEHLGSNPPSSPPAVQGNDNNQGSATETDTDEEWPCVRSLPALVQNLDQHAGNQNGDKEVSNDSLEAPPSQLSQVSNTEYAADCSQNADESPSSSLPPVLQEFRDMFGDGDESYPPDFPMSLRT